MPIHTISTLTGRIRSMAWFKLFLVLLSISSITVLRIDALFQGTNNRSRWCILTGHCKITTRANGGYVVGKTKQLGKLTKRGEEIDLHQLSGIFILQCLQPRNTGLHLEYGFNLLPSSADGWILTFVWVIGF